MDKYYPPANPSHKFKIQEIKLECGIEVEVDWNSKTKCKGCGAEIYWAVTKNEKVIPIELVGFMKWDTHWALCKSANKFRKKKLSRQRKWAIKKQKENLCIICGKPEVVSCYCEEHRKQNNKQSSKYYRKLRAR